MLKKVWLMNGKVFDKLLLHSMCKLLWLSEDSIPKTKLLATRQAIFIIGKGDCF